MKISVSKKYVCIVIFMTICNSNFYAQVANLTVNQNAKFEQMLNEKRKINSSITVNDRYKIQIYSGDSEGAKKTFLEFRKDNKDFDGTIIFNTPSYKVWVGNFTSRIQAEKNLLNFKKKYSNAFLIKPNK